MMWMVDKLLVEAPLIFASLLLASAFLTIADFFDEVEEFVLKAEEGLRAFEQHLAEASYLMTTTRPSSQRARFYNVIGLRIC
ncbi:unnamed protein product, partial [Mesorhabditis spiculigera]